MIFSSTSQVIFTDTSVPPLQFSSQKQSLDTYHSYTLLMYCLDGRVQVDYASYRETSSVITKPRHKYSVVAGYETMSMVGGETAETTRDSKGGANRRGGASCRKFVLEAPRIDTSKRSLFGRRSEIPPTKVTSCWSVHLFAAVYYPCFIVFFKETICINLINSTGREWVNVFVVTCYDNPFVNSEIEYNERIPLGGSRTRRQ